MVTTIGRWDVVDLEGLIRTRRRGDQSPDITATIRYVPGGSFESRNEPFSSTGTEQT